MTNLLLEQRFILPGGFLNEQNAVLTLLGMPQVTLTAQDVQTSLLAVGVEIEKYSYGTKLARELRAI